MKIAIRIISSLMVLFFLTMTYAMVNVFYVPFFQKDNGEEMLLMDVIIIFSIPAILVPLAFAFWSYKIARGKIPQKKAYWQLPLMVVLIFVFFLIFNMALSSF